MTLSDIFPRWYEIQNNKVIDGQRAKTTWKQFTGLHRLSPKQYTTEAVAKEIVRLGKIYSPSTIRRSLADLAVFSRWMVEQKIIAEVPKWKAPAESKPRQRWLTKEEIQKLLEVGRREDVPLWFDWILNLSFLTGQRITSILTLEWAQIQHGAIDFNIGMTRRHKRRGVVPVTAAIKAILSECEGGSKRYVITHDGQRVSRDRFKNQWQRACKLAGIEGAVPHSMRHSVATNLIAAGVPVLEVSKLLGHSNSQITERVYMKFAPSYTRNASDAMAAMLVIPNSSGKV